MLGLHEQTAPRAEVGPSERGRAHENLLGLLHDGIVHRNALTLGVAQVYLPLLLLRAVDVEHTFEHARDGRLVDAEGVDDGAHAPDEDARIPEEVVLPDILRGRLQVGLFPERVHAEYLLVAGRGCPEVGLYVAVARLRARGLHAERDNGIGLARKLEALPHHAAELLHVGHKGIRGRHHHIGLGVDGLDAPTHVGDARRSVAAAGFQQDIAFRHIGQLLMDEGEILAIGDHPHTLGRANACKAVVGELEQGAPHTKDINKLLRSLNRTHGPETTAYASCHYHNVVIHNLPIISLFETKRFCKYNEKKVIMLICGSVF